MKDKNMLKKSVSVFLSYIYCNSLVLASTSDPLLNRESVHWQDLMKYSDRLNKNNIYIRKNSNNSGLDSILDHPLKLAGVGVLATLGFRWVLYPVYDVSRSKFHYIIHPAYRAISNRIGRPVEQILERAKDLAAEDLEKLGKDLEQNGGWLTEEGNIKTLIKLWNIKVKFESDNMFKAFGKMVMHFTVYPIQKGTGISRDNKNVMGSKNKEYPLRVHNGEAFDGHLEVVDAMFPTLSNAFNRVNSFDTRLVSTDFVVAQILHFFFDKGGLPHWSSPSEAKPADGADKSSNGAANLTRMKGKHITWIKELGDKIPYAHSVYDQGNNNLKSLGQTVNDGTHSSFSTKGVVWYNDNAFFIKIPQTCTIRQASDFIQKLKDVTPSKGEKKLYQYSVANFVRDQLLPGDEKDSHVFVFHR